MPPDDTPPPGAEGGGATRQGWIARSYPGVLLAVVIALAASFLSEHYGGPAMLFALLIGMAFNYLSSHASMESGIELSSKTLLRIGVALLGLRLTFADVSELGWTPIAGVFGLVCLTFLTGIIAARLMGRGLAFGLLSGGSVAICGASAALAIAAVLPKHRARQEDVLFTVLAVTALSTVAMVAYPLLFGALGMEDIEAGYLIGATIHDVAQVVGAGYSVSEPAGDIATFTKLLRVALLPLVLIAVGLIFRSEGKGRAGMPWFVVVFVALMLLRNYADIPEPILNTVNDTSRFLLLTAIAALGVKTSLQQMTAAGPMRLFVVMTSTVVLLLAAIGFAHWVMV